MLKVIQLFHVKWKGLSHIHNSDKPYEHLKLFNGIEVVDRYILEEARRRLAAPGLKAADRHKVMSDLNTFKQVERIMGVRQATVPKGAKSKMEYLCKWRGLGDNQATWEAYGMINVIAREHLVALMEAIKAGRWPCGSNGEKHVQREVAESVIQTVLGHIRDKGHGNDPSDLWKENVVS
jgi:hypothetical protein